MPKGKASMKAMKAKGSQGALQKGSPIKTMKKKEHLKRPAALPQPGQGGMSLEEKMELFQKSKNQNIQSWLDSLTKGQKEAMWQRFANARASLKDPESDNQWSQVAKGKGSDPAKKQLLATFLKLGGDLKAKRDQWQEELVSYTKSFGHLAANQFGSLQALRKGL